MSTTGGLSGSGNSAIEWYLAVKSLLRAIEVKARDALKLYESDGKASTAALKTYMEADCQQLLLRWQEREPNGSLGSLGRHLHFGMDCDFKDIFTHDLPELETRADALLLSEAKSGTEGPVGFAKLLHPRVIESAYRLYHDGHFREAVLNALTAVFDELRRRTGCELDGDALVGRAFSIDHPLLILSELETDSGKSDQKGFMQIFKGAYQGVRNSKAHSLAHNLTPETAAQYLVFASLMMRRVMDAKRTEERP